MKSIQTRRSSVCGAIGVLIFLFASNCALALTTLTVTIASDNNPGGIGEIGDLRYCLNAMNQGLNTTPDDYAIVFAFPMTIQLNGLLPLINNSSNPVNITIGNPGSSPTVTIDGNSGAYSGFFIPIGNVTIQNMVFQNLTARGGNGGDGISGGGGGMGAGGAIYAPQLFLNGSNPSITLMNVSTSNTSAIGGNGGNSPGSSLVGNEGGGGGGGFSGNGGSITATGSTGGAGGGGFGGNGGNVTLSTDDVLGGGGGGGGGLGSRATLGTPTNLGNGGFDQDIGQDGNGYGLLITAGSGGGGNLGGNNAGGGGGGSNSASFFPGGGGGGSSGSNGTQAQGSIAPRPKAAIKEAGATPDGGSAMPSGGLGGDGGGGGGGGIVVTSLSNGIDGQAASGGYGGGGGGGAGTGAYDTSYTVEGGSGGLGGGGGGGGVNLSGTTPADGGNSLGGGGGAGAGPSNGTNALGGTDIGNLGGGSGGAGSDTVGFGFGGGGGGGGSGLGGAIFVDSNLNFTLQALPGVPTTFDTSNGTTQAGVGGAGSNGGSNGFDGSALGNGIFLRSGSALTLMAQAAGDRLTLGANVRITDDTALGAGGTSVFVKGDGTIAFDATIDYQGTVKVDNANFRVDGLIDQAPVFICRNTAFSQQPGKLSGTGTMTGNVFVNTGTISPEAGATLTLGSLTLNPPSVVHATIDAGGASLVAVNGPASLAGTLEVDLDPAVTGPGTYVILTSTAITGTFGSVTFTAATPADYVLSYLPIGNPTFVQIHLLAAQAIANFAATPANPTYASGGTFTVAATGGASGNPVAFSIAPASAAVCSASGAAITMLGAGTCTVLADQAGTTDYVAASQATLVVVINPASQAITNFIATPAGPTYAPGGTFTVAATGGASGNPLTFSIAPASAAVCSASGATITTLGAGTCTLLADQAGDANYTAAPQATLDVAINPAGQAITNFVATPASPTFTPGGTFTVSATGGASGNPLAFSIAGASASVCSAAGATITMLGVGTCTVLADQAGNANYTAATQAMLNVGIGIANQTITNFAATPANPAFVSGGTFTVSATGGASGNPVTFSIAGTSASVCSANGATITMLAAGTCSVQADQIGNANYAAATQATLNVGIGVADQAITNFVATPSNPVLVAGGTFTVSATGGASGNPVTFSIVAASASVCSAGGANGAMITMLGAGTCTVQADQAGNTSYAAATPVTLDVVLSATASTLTLASSQNPSTQYAPVAFTATVGAGAPAGIPVTQGAGSVQVATGTVSFTDGATPLGTANLVGGAATFTMTFATVGSHPVTANYSGDAATAPSSSTINQVVTQAAGVVAEPAPALSTWIAVLLGALFGGVALARLRAMRTRD